MTLTSQIRSTPVARWLRVDPAAKPRIYAQVYASAEISSASYWAEIILSAGIATFGLVLNSPAVIIGAMLISPVMNPIMATGLALAAGDLYLAVKAIANLLVSVAAAITLSAVIVWLLPFHSATSEILARTNPNLLDLGVALFSGLAGSIAVSRAGGVAGTTLPGVAIAVALMPPLCTVGFGLGSGLSTHIMGGAGLLFLTNLVAIVASAFLVFLLLGMNSPALHEEMEHARSGEALAARIAAGPFGKVLVNGGKLHWRIIMLAVLLASIAVPLRAALLQVAGEAVGRSAVQQVIANLVPRGSLVSQQVEVGRDSIAVQLVLTQAIDSERIRAAEKQIKSRSGMATQITVTSIASHSEFAELMQRVTSASPPPPPPPPAPESIATIHDKLIARIKPILSATWPPAAPFQDFDIQLAPEGVVLEVLYQAPADLDAISLDLIQTQLRQQLQDTALTIRAERIPPSRKTSRPRKTRP